MNKGLIAGIVIGGVAVSGAAVGLGVGLTKNAAEYQVNIVSELESAEFEGNGTYQIGDQVELSAQDVEGYRFVYWSLPNGEISRENPYKFTLTNANYGTYTAVYEKEYTITVGEFSNGEITSDRPVAITGEEVTLTVTPDENYHVLNISYTTSSGTTTIEYSEGGYKFLMPSEDVEITATFAQSAFNITKASMTNGDITLSNTSGVNGTEIIVSAQPETGYEIDELYYIEQGSETHVGITNNTFTLTSNVTVYATFKQIEYIISQIPTQVAIKKNNVALTSQDTLHYGDEITILYTATEGYHKTAFEVTGATLKEGETDVYVVTGNITITYAEEINTYTVTFYDEDGETVLDTQTVNYNSTVVYGGEAPTKTSTAKYSYAFDGWDKALSNITQNTDFIAQYTQTLIDYDFTFTNETETDVTIKRNGTIFTGNKVNIDDIITLEYTASEGMDGVINVTGATKTAENTYVVIGDLSITYSEEQHVNEASTYETLSFTYDEEAKTASVAKNSSNFPTGEIFIPGKVKHNDEIYVVTNISPYAFSGCIEITSVTIPSSIKYIGKEILMWCSNLSSVIFETGSQLISIGRYAFGFTGLTEIVIPKSVTNIDESAFQDCSKLSSVTFEEGSQLTSIGQCAFGGIGITSLTIPNSLTKVGFGVFQSCFNLNTVFIPSSVTSIENYVFGNCWRLVEIYNYSSISLTIGSTDNGSVALNAKVIHTSVEEESRIVIIDGVKYYKNSETDYTAIGLADTTKTNITLDEYTTSINKNAFNGYENLDSITIPKSVTNIGEYAFSKCTNLKTVTFEEDSQLISIEKYAFGGCCNLTSIKIPNSVTTIEDYAFNGCSMLVEIYNYSALTLATGSTNNGSVARYAKVIHTSVEEESRLTTIDGVIYYKNSETDYTAIGLADIAKTNIILDEHTTSINKSAFNACYNIVSIIIPSSVTDIGEYAFSNCSKLASITIPSNVTRIRNSTFSNCSSLTSFTISAKINTIETSAFDGCSKLVEIYNSSALTLTTGSTNNGSVARYAKVIHTSVEEESRLTTIDGVIYYKNSETDYTAIGLADITKTNIILDEHTTSINKSAFNACYNIVSIIIPSSVTDIGSSGFGNCHLLTIVAIDSSDTYRTATSSTACGWLLSRASTVKVLKSIVDDETNTNNYLNSAAWTKAAETETIDGQEYYVYTKN